MRDVQHHGYKSRHGDEKYMNCSRTVIYGFTLLEVLISIAVFSIGLLAYMTYQGRTSSMLFDTESSIIASSLAVEIAEEINSMAEVDFLAVITAAGDPLPNDWLDDDANFKAFSPLLNFTSGPFDSFGNPVADGETPMFYRKLRIRTYDNLSGVDHPENSPLDVLRIIEVVVGWNQKDSPPSLQCNTMPMPNGCNEIRLMVIKPTSS